MSRVRLHWANGRVTELHADARATIIRVPTPGGVRSFRAAGTVDEEGFGVFVEDTDLPAVTD
jgi:hypothetical protein